MILSFILGLLLGLLTLGWYRAQVQGRLKHILSDLKPHHAISSLPVLSQISTAIANQKRKYQTLEARVQRYQFMLEHAPIGFLHIDDENRLVWCNHFAQTLFNLSPSQFSQSQYPQPRLLLEVIRSYELDQLTEQVRRDGKLCDKEWTFFPINADPARVRKQKSYGLRGQGIPLFDRHVGIFIENRQDLVVLKQQRDRWTSDVAHELKTPLTSIRLIAETLQSRLDLPLVGWANRLVNQSTRLSTLVQDLLDISQLEMDGHRQDSLSIKAIRLPDLIQSVWFNLDPIARKKELNFQYIGPSDLIAYVDESHMFRVMLNVLDNSIKYSPPQGTIVVKVQIFEGREPWEHDHQQNDDLSEAHDNISQDAQRQDHQDIHQDIHQYPGIEEGGDRVFSLAESPIETSTHWWIQIEVMDAGQGFLDNDLPHIFERFYRADTSRTRTTFSNQIHSSGEPLQSYSDSPSSLSRLPATSAFSNQSSLPGGTGLGLAIVHQIIKAHRGDIEAQNHPQTGGAMIRIRLPQNKPSS